MKKISKMVICGGLIMYNDRVSSEPILKCTSLLVNYVRMLICRKKETENERIRAHQNGSLISFCLWKLKMVNS
jgi:hypothetical protein